MAMHIERPVYLRMLRDRMHNGLVKVVTGLRRSGKSYLLFRIFKEHLLSTGVPPDHIIGLALDMRSSRPYRDPDFLLAALRSRMQGGGSYYVFLDEVQMLEDFESVLNELLHWQDTDIYVTGSNSRFLSSDVLTEFRGRGDEVRIHPLSFREFTSAFRGGVEAAWQEYFTYGGLPQLLAMPDDGQKISYLRNLFEVTYLKDIRERNHIRHEQELEALLNMLASAVGSLTNPRKLCNAFRSRLHGGLSESTIVRYCRFLEDSFLIAKASRYDVKGKEYINTPFKYYFEDVGLRNALLNFRQQEENHIMENIIYNELRCRGYAVDVGLVEVREREPDGGSRRKQLEIDFVANQGSRRHYVQSAFAMATPEKERREKRPYLNVRDSFRKVILVREDIKSRQDEDGIVTMGVLEFLLRPDSLEA